MTGDPIRAQPKPAKREKVARQNLGRLPEASGRLSGPSPAAGRVSELDYAGSDAVEGRSPMFPKPTRRPPKARGRLPAVSAKRQQRIDAGAERPGMARSWMKRGPGDTAYARRPRDFGRMLFVKSLYCYVGSVYGSEDCSRVIEAHHAGERGLGQKAPDDTCIPLCRRHHQQATDYSGFFAQGNWPTPGSRTGFVKGAIADTQAAWEALNDAEQSWWNERAAESFAARRSAS